MTFTRQEPYVGEKYESSSLFGVRVMVVGASHYCEHFDKQTMCTAECKSYGKYRNICGQHFGERCEKFTINVVRRYLGRDASHKDSGWKRTLTKFLKTLFEGFKATSNDCRKLLEHLVFAEYLQGAEGKNSSDKNVFLFEDVRHYEALLANISNCRPDVVIVWGSRVRRQIEQRPCGDVPFVMIPHPAWPGYYRSEPQKQLVLAGIRLVNRKELY